MIVPRYWAEGWRDGVVRGRRKTIRRFGWSDVSPADAQAMADQRAADALDRFTAGERVPARESKVPYNGADGMPIREEILREVGTAVVTRNSYGAQCLNTPDVLFVDIDFEDPPRFWQWAVIATILCAAAAGIGVWLESAAAGLAIGVAALPVSWLASEAVTACRVGWAGGREAIARRRIDGFAEARPDWNIRLYRTPAGFRVLVLHRTFDPREEEVAECFAALGADPQYARMCVRQNCFRARVSPKPWRIGIARHMRPRPGVWPVAPERLPIRNRWIEEYEVRAREFAACHFVEALGMGGVHPSAATVQRLHDDLARANTSLPLA
jgi:hypothetical protein